MNERIKELITKSNGYWEHGDFNMPRTVCFDEADVEKFAQLIVKECMNLVDRGGEFVSRPKLVERIKEHFGVEE